MNGKEWQPDLKGWGIGGEMMGGKERKEGSRAVPMAISHFTVYGNYHSLYSVNDIDW